MESLQGNFLIATPQMPDPRFKEQVIFICSHNTDGAMGFVVNRPSEHSLVEIFKSANIDYKEAAWPLIHIGGPVEDEAAFFLYSSEYHSEHCMPINREINLSRDPRILHDIAVGLGPDEFLFLLGYAGWAPGQLETELTVNGWLTLPADSGIIFKTPAASMWKKAAESYGIDIALFGDEIGNA